MSETVASGVLPALVAYYNRLSDDPEKRIASFGFSQEKIHLCVLLEPDGTRPTLVDLREKNNRGKSTFTPMEVPDGGGRSGSGLKPYFCWDNTGYALGRDNKGKPERAEQMFAAFRDFHLSMREAVGEDTSYSALCQFLAQWDPVQAERLEGWEELAGLNVVFRIRGHAGYVHQSDAVRNAWISRLSAAEEGQRGRSLLTGKEEELARLHPLISGVSGTNTTGAAIVSFNLSAFESYGRTQSYNAPVGARDAFHYTTAINHLLADGRRRVRIGDATTVFWSDRNEAAEAEDVLHGFFAEELPPAANKGEAAEYGETVDRVRRFLELTRQGRLAEVVDNPNAPFYVLGLSPNASRITIRFWMASTVAELAERIRNHVDDLEMIGARPDAPPLAIRRLLRETARDPKDIPPQLVGAVARSVLFGLPYPQALFNAVIRRARLDTTVNHCRAAILKAYLIRNRKRDVPMALDVNHSDEVYHLGRLFAAIEKTQEDASGGQLNSTIKDRYFGAASATPASVFPRLLRLHQHHLNKYDDAGRRVSREKLISEICGRICRFPSYLPLEKQGLFYIAYYHQRQDFFIKKNTEKAATHE